MKAKLIYTRHPQAYPIHSPYEPHHRCSLPIQQMLKVKPIQIQTPVLRQSTEFTIPLDIQRPMSGCLLLNWLKQRNHNRRKKRKEVVKRLNTVSPFSYLGVFKLSCRVCPMWIQVLNDQGGLRFYTRGTHGNWYWLWGLPTLKEDSLSIYMVKEMRKSYHQHCRAQGRLKTLSNRSTTGTASTRLLNPIAESFFNSNFSMPPG